MVAEGTVNPILELKSFDDVYIDEKSHSYYYNDEKLKSTTSFMKRFEKPFNKQFISKAVAKRDGKTQAEVLREWDYKRDMSIVKGKSFHNYMESLLNRIHPEYDEFELMTIDEQGKYYVDYIKSQELSLLKTELVICDPSVMLGGTIDALFFDNEMNIHIRDWKTNNDFTTTSKYKLTNEFSKYEASHLNKYSIQLLIYKILLERTTQLNVMIPKIVWFHEDNDSWIEYDVVTEFEPILNEIIEKESELYSGDLWLQ